MKLDWWWPLQARLAREFGHDSRRETVALRMLQRMAHPSGELPRFTGRSVVVAGAGLRPDEVIPSGLLVAADGAVRACRAQQRLPVLVVSDLDGYRDDLRWAISGGAALIVHGHGDNLVALGEWLPRLQPVAVTATRPAPGVACWGGFTDGDRAVLTALGFGARRVRLAGFRFDAVGPYSGSSRGRLKQQKLVWAQRILRAIAQRYPALEF